MLCWCQEDKPVAYAALQSEAEFASLWLAMAKASRDQQSSLNIADTTHCLVKLFTQIISFDAHNAPMSCILFIIPILQKETEQRSSNLPKKTG